jgi:16S rRNA (cytosine1402-N4)-methyltransferase
LNESLTKGEEMQDVKHIPVALDRCIELLTPSISNSQNPVIVDATLGLGGHSYELLTKFPNLRIIAIDRDPGAIEIAKNRLAKFSDRITFNHAIYSEIEEVLVKNNIEKIDGALFDLGVSSMQLDLAERGFSYSKSAKLDMRMDQSRGITAQDVIDSYEKPALVKVLREYGEEKFATRIAENIIKNRGHINDTETLVELIKSSIPAPARRTGGNPAKRTFQALRIEVNGELKAIEIAIPAALNALKVNGRVVVLSYQSLEDKIVKRIFADFSKSKSPLGLPIELPNSKSSFQLITRGSEGPSMSEIEVNPRAQSLRLRAIERVAA